MLKLKLNDGWEYTVHTGMTPPPDAQWTPVTLPHDASIERERSATYPTGGGGGYAWSGVLTYRRELYVPEEWRGQSLQLEFEGVYMNATVMVNRDTVALHPYGYTSFVVDITPHITFGATNRIMVRVNNSAQPNSRWYTGTGIYRHVWLRRGGATRIVPWGVFVRTESVRGSEAKLKITTTLAGQPGASATIQSAILDCSGEQVASTTVPLRLDDQGQLVLDETVTLHDARLWSLQDPCLYTLQSQVLADDTVIDQESTTFGIRTLAMDAEQGLRLNGVPLKLKGGCVHHDNGLLGAASYDRAEERKVELMLAAGYNAIRCAHNPPAPAMLEACDRLGMLVIDETFDCWRMGKNLADYHLYFEDWWARDTASMVLRDRNHPSVIMWSIGNEVSERGGISDGPLWARRQAELIRSLDETRPVTSALPFLFEAVFTDGQPSLGSVTAAQGAFNFDRLRPTDCESDRWGNLTEEFCDALDMVGYNYLYPRYDFDAQRFPQRVLAGTETFPSVAYDTWKATEALPQVIGDFVWTSIDYLGESGIGKVTLGEPGGFGTPFPYHLANCGDIDICGFKRAQSYYRDVMWGVRTAPWVGVLRPSDLAAGVFYNPWGWEPVSDSWSFPGEEGRTTRVDVYSPDDEIELVINGRSQGRRPAGDANRFLASFDVVYEPGYVEAIAYRDGQETGRTRLETTEAPGALRLTADREGLCASYGDLAYVTVEVVDAACRRVPWAAERLSFAASGPAQIIAVGSGEPTSEELYTGPTRTTYQGRLMVVLRGTGAQGTVTLEARGEGLTGATLTMEAR
ncbi:MAG: glycoside hydrolase family 2 TIM barrel-domain containing protein [Anaerolineae bacterium]|jgi:beta-galactosidase|nr:glycoside hydrolase family 2 protein [Chloroflexota bacterium]